MPTFTSRESCMADKLISSLELHPRIHAAVNKARLSTIKSVLVFSVGDIFRRTGLSRSDVNSLIAAASTALVNDSVYSANALQLYRDKGNSLNHGRLSTGCVSLDALLHGGLLVPGINEIVGMSGAGKTQLCLQLCLSAQLPCNEGGLDGGAVYICTEDAFPSKRWHQLAISFASKYSRLHLTANKLSDNLYIEHAATVASLSKQLHYKLPYLLSQHSVKLVVIDSIAALFRVEYGADQAIQRAQLLRQFGHQLQKLSECHSMAVVCVNQVTAAMDSRTPNSVKPALGLTWADIVTMRLMLSRPEGVDSTEEHSKQPTMMIPRTLQILLAPHLPQSTLQYYIDSDGIKALD